MPRTCLSTAVKRSKDHYDVKWHVNSYALDEIVGYVNEKNTVGKTLKLRPTYLGPVPVKKKVDYIIQLDASGRELLIHRDKLQPYEGEAVTSVDYIIQLDASGRELLIHRDKLKPYEGEAILQG